MRSSVSYMGVGALCLTYLGLASSANARKRRFAQERRGSSFE